MAVMMTVDDLRVALGADLALMARIASIHTAASARVERYAPSAPEAVQNEALIVFSGWIYQAQAQRRNVFPTDNEGPPINASRAFLLSGAQGLLSSWRRPRAGACR